eukprot:scaffold173750_cov34-Prasinocladus_malaysianus.AAC.2
MRVALSRWPVIWTAFSGKRRWQRSARRPPRALLEIIRSGPETKAPIRARSREAHIVNRIDALSDREGLSSS